MINYGDHLFAFFQGILSSLSACVYPLLPVITAMFSRFAGENAARGKILILSFTYLAGMVFSYVGLGVIAALSGSIFGSWLANPLVSSLLGLLLVVLGLIYLELIPFQFKSFSDNKALQMENKFLSALVLGLFSALVAAPCAAPLFGSVLIEIARQAAENESIIPGVSMGFSFSLGMGLPFMLAGILSMKLPKSGNWLSLVKIVGGTILITAGLHYFDLGKLSQVSGNLVSIVLLTLLYVVFLYTAWKIYHHPTKPQFLYKVVLLFSVLSLFSATTIYSNAGQVKQTQGQWTYSFSDHKKYSLSLVDFWADWCVACKEMEKEYFSKPEFKDLKEKFNLGLIKVDLSDFENETANEIADRYGVQGLPTLILIDKSGEAKATILGYENAKKLDNELTFHLNSILGEDQKP